MRTRRLVVATAFRGGLLISVAVGLVMCRGTKAPTAPTSTAAASITIEFVSSTPPPNTIVVTGASANNEPPGYLDASALSMTLSVRSDRQVAGTKLKIDLLDSSGTTCGYGSSDPQDLLPGIPTSFTTRVFVWQCTVPTSTESVRATVLTPTGPVQQFIRVRYIYQPYPAPPNVPPSAPTIATLGWQSTVLGCAGACWAPGDTLAVYCGVFEADGASVTSSMTVTWDGYPPQTMTTVFPSGASSVPGHYVHIQWSSVEVTGAASVLDTEVPRDGPPLQHATAVCSAVNPRGEAATKTINVPF
jgi:hypothetical protein